MSWGEMLMVLEIVSLTGFVTCFYGALSKQQKKMSKEATTPLCLVNNWNHISVYLHLHTFTDLFGGFFGASQTFNKNKLAISRTGGKGRRRRRRQLR